MPNKSSTTTRDSSSPGNLKLLRDVRLDVSLCFGHRSVPLGEILALNPQSVLALDQSVDDPVDLLVGGKLVGRGEVVTSDGKYALRLTEVVGSVQGKS